MLHDVFISHASEDKADFVRPLADRLRKEHVDVWYDEFTLRVGDPLRRSISDGLRQSRFGIVVLSQNFFDKAWPEWELDGLTARDMGEHGILLPVWHGVTRDDVLRYSPPLADKVAVSSTAGIEEVVRKLCEVIRPQGSTLVIARDLVIEMGFDPPVVTDDWWLDAAAASEPNDMEGGWQSAMGWGRWGFPLPPRSREPAERGYRLAYAAMQMEWQNAADAIPITQVTPPEQVHKFIDEMPGLAETCHEFPHYLAVYAPQLCIPGFGGQFEELFTTLYEMSQADEPSKGPDPHFRLRNPNIGTPGCGADAYKYFFGYGVSFGPSAQYYQSPEYIAWLLSDSSRFLPAPIRASLTSGMAEMTSWPWNENELNPLEKFGYHRVPCDGRLWDALMAADSFDDFKPGSDAVGDAVHRMGFAAELLGLPESGEQLAEPLLSAEFLRPYFANREPLRDWDED